MNYITPPERSVRSVMRELRALRGHGGPGPSELWPRLAAAAAQLCRADLALVLGRDADGAWQPIASHEQVYLREADKERYANAATGLAERAAANGFALEPVASGAVMVAGAMEPADPDVPTAPVVSTVVVVLLTRQTPAQHNEAAVRLQLIGDIGPRDDRTPAASRPGAGFAGEPVPTVDPAAAGSVTLPDVFDLVVVLVGKDRYRSACLTLCNEIASRFNCLRVSLGDSRRGLAKVRAISHVERFETRTDAILALEAVMEEALDQDEIIDWPADEETGALIAAHERLARLNGLTHLVSLPLRDKDEPFAVIVCECATRTLSDDELRLLHVAADLSAPWLAALRRRDRPLPVRLWRQGSEAVQELFTARRMVSKLAVLLGAVGLVALLLSRWTYQVEAPALLKTDQVAYVPAPFDGYVDAVEIRIGDRVDRGRTLLTLDTAELYLKESEAAADILHYTRLADKARAQGSLAEMRIAEAQTDQARARQDRVRYYLEHADVASPIEGIVVEGDRKELVGAAVRKGDVLFKVARMEGFYFELQIDEADVHEIRAGETGEVTLLSRTDQRFPVRIERLDPAAQVKPDVGTVFLARAAFTGEQPPWWRPGMSGLAHLTVEPKPLIWIAFHRVIDYLRLHYWI